MVRNIDQINRIKCLAKKAVKNLESDFFFEKFKKEWDRFVREYGKNDINVAAEKDLTFSENIEKLFNEFNNQNKQS